MVWEYVCGRGELIFGCLRLTQGERISAALVYQFDNGSDEAEI